MAETGMVRCCGCGSEFFPSHPKAAPCHGCSVYVPEGPLQGRHVGAWFCKTCFMPAVQRFHSRSLSPFDDHRTHRCAQTYEVLRRRVYPLVPREHKPAENTIINGALPEELVVIILAWVGRIAPWTLLTAVPHVCTMWRALVGQASFPPVSLDLRRLTTRFYFSMTILTWTSKWFHRISELKLTCRNLYDTDETLAYLLTGRTEAGTGPGIGSTLQTLVLDRVPIMYSTQVEDQLTPHGWHIRIAEAAKSNLTALSLCWVHGLYYGDLVKISAHCKGIKTLKLTGTDVIIEQGWEDALYTLGIDVGIQKQFPELEHYAMSSCRLSSEHRKNISMYAAYSEMAALKVLELPDNARHMNNKELQFNYKEILRAKLDAKRTFQIVFPVPDEFVRAMYPDPKTVSGILPSQHTHRFGMSLLNAWSFRELQSGPVKTAEELLRLVDDDAHN